MRKILACLLYFFITYVGNTQQINIIPQPVSLKVGNGTFTITNKTWIAYDAKSVNSANFLAGYLKTYYNISCKLSSDIHGEPSIVLMFGSTDKKGFYELDIDKTGISIGGDQEGIFNGVQSLIQILPTENQKSKTKNQQVVIPQVKIEDYPRFAYRGMHLDVSRHFFPVSFVKKYIDYLALHKLNIFHWHLTDDQGWRIEIKKYPELTKTGAWRNGSIIGRYPGKGSDNKPVGGFYTQDEIKDVVQYAADRFIDVIPEIEMPGHASAAIAAYPWLSCFPNKPTDIPANMISQKSIDQQKNGRIKLVQETWGVFDDVFCAGNDSTFMFLENVLDEVTKLFPSKYVHVGGDECPKVHWKICPKCQQRMKELGLKDEHELQSYLIQRIEKYLTTKNKKLIGWDEILEGGLAPNATVMSWRGEQGGIDAARQKHNVIMTPGNPVYFDHSQSENEDSVTIGGYNPIEKVYAYEPVPKELKDDEQQYILGAQANVWTEYIDNPKKVEYTVFPRMAALSEILWSKKENRNWDDFQKRLPEQFKRYDLWKVNYSKAYYDVKTAVLPSDKNDEVLFSIKSERKNVFIHAEFLLANSSGFTGKLKPVLFNDTIFRIRQTGELGYFTLDNSDAEKSSWFKLNSQYFHFNKATGKKITLVNPPSKNYPGNGAFTLVNGVINTKGLSKSKEFLGFNGTDCEAIIDLGKEETINSIKVNVLEEKGSWIYAPAFMKIYYSDDGINFKEATNAEAPKAVAGEPVRNIKWGFYPASKTRYLKVFLKNYGIIPDGQPGAGNKAWLFVDEIEVN